MSLAGAIILSALRAKRGTEKDEGICAKIIGPFTFRCFCELLNNRGTSSLGRASIIGGKG